MTFEYFDKLVQQIDDPNGKAKDGTRRWPVGKSISVYFDTVNTPVGYTPAHREIAWSAVSTWPTLIGGDVISVHEVYFASAADVTVHWVPSGSLGANTIGLCISNDDFEITKAKLQLTCYTDGLLLSLAVHEFGHTLHLGHSPVRGDIIHQLQTGVTAPSDQEIEATRILTAYRQRSSSKIPCGVAAPEWYEFREAPERLRRRWCWIWLLTGRSVTISATVSARA